MSIEQLQQLPEYATNPFVARMFELFDTDGDGVVTLDEFAAAIKTFSGQARCTVIHSLELPQLQRFSFPSRAFSLSARLALAATLQPQQQTGHPAACCPFACAATL